jgi:hypothetical protein
MVTSHLGGSPNEATGPANSVAQGLLDLSVELSSPQVFFGTRFALYLRIKNPFSTPVWIRRVETNLPANVHTADSNDRWRRRQSSSDSTRQAAEQYVSVLLARLTSIQQRLAEFDRNRDQHEVEIIELHKAEDEVNRQLREGREVMFAAQGYDIVSVRAGSIARIENARIRRAAFLAEGESEVRIENLHSDGAEEVVTLTSSLPVDVALQPGSDSVWTLTLYTKKNPFFLPAAYRLNLTVLYAFEQPSEAAQDDRAAVHSNTAPTTVNIRASLWWVMAGSVIGGLLGATARLLQQANTTATQAGAALGEATSAPNIIGSMLLAVILSIAAAIFAARKSETQSFVSVEDFWGGALVGFIIGYSGTAAFENLTRVRSDPGTA